MGESGPAWTETAKNARTGVRWSTSWKPAAPSPCRTTGGSSPAPIRRSTRSSHAALAPRAPPSTAAFWDDARLCELVRALKAAHPDCAVTLSVGERSAESYRALREAGADRYLLRHETATPAHYAKLHPPALSWENRMRCLRDLRALGYQVGCGFMVGSPFQTAADLARDLKFVEEFKPEMCGIGPFVPHRETPFAHEPAGSAALTCRLLSIIRLIHPPVLLPATTALGTVDPRGREKGLLAGANVVMPNLSPVAVRKDYDLYDNKICTGEESAQCRGCLARRVESVGLRLVVDRGDFRPGS